MKVLVFFLLSFSAVAQADTRLQRLQELASFSSEGMLIFAATSPSLLTNPAFSEACNRHEDISSLGCFDGKTIKIFDVKEARLEGLMASTAAHEMLHAAYKKLSRAEKTRIDGLITKALPHIQNPDVLTKFAEYKKRDPTVMASEYHSIIGTEIENLPTELEAHYGRYFRKRAAVVALTQEFYDELRSRKKTIALTDSELDKRREDIELRMKLLKTRQSHLDVLRKNLDAAENSTRDNVESYNQLVEKFNKELRDLRQQTDEFNKMARERNQKAIESQKLYESLNSNI